MSIQIREDIKTRMQKVKYIVSDMDGTLLGKDHTVLPANRDMVHRLHDKGIGFTIATGRVDYMVALFAEQLRITDPIISCNGALVRSLDTGKTLVKNMINPSSAREILQYFNALDFDILAYEQDRICHASDSVRIGFFHHYNEIARQAGSEEVKLQAFNKVEETFYDGQEYMKLFIWQPDQEKLDHAAKHLASRYPDLYFVRSTQGSLDITAKGTTKGSAILALAKYHQISPEEIAVFGDQDNDVAMFLEAGVSFAMENASEQAKMAADLVIGHHQDAALAKTIEAYCFG